MYRPLKEPLGAFWGMITGLFGWASDKKDDAVDLFKSKKKDIEFQ